MEHMTVEQRNTLVEQYMWCIDSVMRQNEALIRAARLDRDDVYQELAVRLIRAVELYKPGKRCLKGYIFMQLQYELLNCKSPQRVYGFRDAPFALRNAVVSLEALEAAVPDWELSIAA